MDGRPPESPWSRHGPAIVLGAMLLTVAATVLTVRGLLLMRDDPAWWQPLDTDDPTVIRTATALENAISSHVTDVELVGTRWETGMRSPEVNAWLNARLPRWVESESDLDDWPDELDQLQVRFVGPHIDIGARIREDDRSRVLAATLLPEVHEDGTLWLRAESVSIGRLRLPASWVLGGLEAQADDVLPPAFRSVQDIDLRFDALAGRRPMALEPVVNLPDGREVRLLRLSVAGDQLQFTFRTEVD